jgi:hypothetical protein
MVITVVTYIVIRAENGGYVHTREAESLQNFLGQEKHKEIKYKLFIYFF